MRGQEPRDVARLRRLYVCIRRKVPAITASGPYVLRDQRFANAWPEPFATMPVGYIREFIPAYATAMFVISSITSALLFVQFSVVHSRALLAVSGGLGCEPDPVCLRDWSAHDSMAPKPRYRGLKQMR